MGSVAIVAVVICLALVAIVSVSQLKSPKDRCTDRDREINNCVPAGKCHPNPGLDALIDCDVKSYDKKLNPEL